MIEQYRYYNSIHNNIDIITQYWFDNSIDFQRKNINPDEDEEVTEVFWAPTMRRWYVIHLFLKAWD